MTNSDIDTVASQVKDILLAERAMLASGQVAKVLALSEDKSTAIQKLEQMLKDSAARGPVSQLQHHVKEIASLAKENEQHFLTVHNGIKSLIGRLRTGDGSVRAGLYNQYGEDVLFSGATGSYLKKA